MRQPDEIKKILNIDLRNAWFVVLVIKCNLRLEIKQMVGKYEIFDAKNNEDISKTSIMSTIAEI
ncbi:MAG: hypothetical protein U0T36_09390 [Saprospiraceae bacterium]